MKKNNELPGVSYSEEEISFRVWAPREQKVMLNLYRAGDSCTPYLVEPMLKQGEYFIRTMAGRPDGFYYTYTVNDRETIDPYAKAGGANGERGEVLDFRKTDPDGWENDSFTPQPPVIWELHLRDFSADPYLDIPDHGKFSAFRNGVKTKNGFTALLDYVKELGVTYVHFLPLADFGSIDELNPFNYNWGYDPQNYGFPEGSYSSDPRRGEVRIREMKEMILKLHQNGIGVILDVVFNHTYKTYEYSLERTAPGAYYRMENGKFLDGSGCGNELATENPPVRKFIIHNLLWWLQEYHVDGFRFDLMGLIDVETMNEIRTAIDNALPNGKGKDILLYGEPWGGFGGSGAKVPLADLYHIDKIDERIALFNPTLRDGIRGVESFGNLWKGYIQGEEGCADKVRSGIEGAIHARNYSPDFTQVQSPAQQIAYASCHDGFTLFDCCKESMPDSPDVYRAHRMGLFIVLSALGIPLLMAGEEFFRTKNGCANSYNLPDSVNQLDWKRREEFDDNVRYVAELIAIRKRNPVFCDLAHAQAHFEWLPCGNPQAIAYRIGKFVYCVNGTKEEAFVHMASVEKAVLLADGKEASRNGLREIALPYTVAPGDVFVAEWIR